MPDKAKRGDDITVLKSSFEAVLQTRAKERDGCMSLPFTVAFFVTYILGIMNHEDVRSVYLVESEMREFIETYTFDEGGSRTLEGIMEPKDLWLFMKEALLPAVFVQTDHNGKALPKEKWGKVLVKNRLKGGVLLEQSRLKEFKFSNATADFLYFPGEGTVLADDAFGAFSESEESRLLLDKLPDWGSNVEDTEAEDRRLRGKTSNMGGSKTSGGAQSHMVTYPFFLFEQEPFDVLMKRVRYLEEMNWIDEHTTQLDVKIVLFNEDVQLLQLLRLNFLFPSSGGIFPKLYFQSSYAEAYKSILVYFCDAMWVLLLLGIFFQEFKEVWAALKGGKGALRLYFNDIWNCIDWASIVLGFAVVGMFNMERGMVKSLQTQIFDTTGGDTNLQYMANMYKMHSEAQKLSNMAMWYRLLLADYTMIIMMRFFKAFKGQARLALVTNTIVSASSDLFHFGIVFLSAFLAYTFAGTVLFGRRLNGFSTFQKSFGTCFAIAMGDFDWSVLSSEHLLTATIWFSSFMILIFMVMLNMVLAIVMDTYTSVRSQAINGDPIWVSLGNATNRFKHVPKYVWGKAMNHAELPVAEISDQKIEKELQRLGQNVNMARLQNVIPNLSDKQAEKILLAVQNYEKQQTEGGMNISDALRMIGVINGKVEDLVRKVDVANKQDPRIAAADPQQKKAKARRKFKRAVFTALYSGELEKVAAQLQSETFLDDVKERDLMYKIQKATAICNENVLSPIEEKATKEKTEKPEKSEKEQKKEQKLNEHVLKEIQSLKAQTKSLELSIADLSSHLKSSESKRQKAEEKERKKDTTDYGQGEDTKVGDRNCSTQGAAPTGTRGSSPAGARKKKRGNQGGKEEVNAVSDSGPALQNIEEKLEDMSNVLNEVKEMKDMSNILQEVKEMKDMSNILKEVQKLQNIQNQAAPHVAPVAADPANESRLLEMSLLIKDLHQIMNAMRGEWSGAQSANNANVSDKTSGLVLHDIRGLSQRTQSIGTMVLEVLRCMNDVKAALTWQAQMFENGLESRNANVKYANVALSQATPPSAQLGGNAGGSYATPGAIPPSSQFSSAVSSAEVPRWDGQVGDPELPGPYAIDRAFPGRSAQAINYRNPTQHSQDALIDPMVDPNRAPSMYTSLQHPQQHRHQPQQPTPQQSFFPSSIDAAQGHWVVDHYDQPSRQPANEDQLSGNIGSVIEQPPPFMQSMLPNTGIEQSPPLMQSMASSSGQALLLLPVGPSSPRVMESSVPGMMQDPGPDYLL